MSTVVHERSSTGFQHEVVMYDGVEGYVDATVPFITRGLEAGETVLVVVPAQKIALLRSALGSRAENVMFRDMEQAGRNPARIIPLWKEFLQDVAGSRRVRGIGEPIYEGRGQQELDECQRHERLLNEAFRSSPAWQLLCPYDTRALPGDVIAQAHRTHPWVLGLGDADTELPSSNADFVDAALGASTLAGTLPPPPPGLRVLHFEGGSLDMVRGFVRAHAQTAGLDTHQVNDLLLAVNEIATNSLRYGGGQGELRVWRVDQHLVCEVRDAGVITDPLIGRHWPDHLDHGGRGVWLANQLCDLVQIRSSAQGTVVRLHLHGVAA